MRPSTQDKSCQSEVQNTLLNNYQLHVKGWYITDLNNNKNQFQMEYLESSKLPMLSTILTRKCRSLLKIIVDEFIKNIQGSEAQDSQSVSVTWFVNSSCWTFLDGL